jgi:hypothetical protein
VPNNTSAIIASISTPSDIVVVHQVKHSRVHIRKKKHHTVHTLSITNHRQQEHPACTCRLHVSLSQSMAHRVRADDLQ